MRTATLALSGLVGFSGIVSVILWKDLRAERQSTASLQVQLTDLHAQLAEAKTLSRSQVASEKTPVIAATVPAGTSDPPPAIVPISVQSATAMNPQREVLSARDEISKAQELLADTPYTVNQTGQMRAKPSNIMTNNDLNKDGFITKEEATRSGKALIQIWNAYDLNKDDIVDEAEITKASGL